MPFRRGRERAPEASASWRPRTEAEGDEQRREQRQACLRDHPLAERRSLCHQHGQYDRHVDDGSRDSRELARGRKHGVPERRHHKCAHAAEDAERAPLLLCAARPGAPAAVVTPALLPIAPILGQAASSGRVLALSLTVDRSSRPLALLAPSRECIHLCDRRLGLVCGLVRAGVLAARPFVLALVHHAALGLGAAVACTCLVGAPLSIVLAVAPEYPRGRAAGHGSVAARLPRQPPWQCPARRPRSAHVSAALQRRARRAHGRCRAHCLARKPRLAGGRAGEYAGVCVSGWRGACLAHLPRARCVAPRLARAHGW